MTPKSESKPTKNFRVKATKAFMQTRFICLPSGLVTKEQFKKLKAGEAVEVSTMHKLYFTEDRNNGNS